MTKQAAKKDEKRLIRIIVIVQLETSIFAILENTRNSRIIQRAIYKILFIERYNGFRYGERVEKRMNARRAEF